MLGNVFFHPTTGSFDVESIRRYLDAQSHVFLDPLGSGTYIMAGSPEGVPIYRDARIAEPDRFPWAVLITVKPEEVHVDQDADRYQLLRARDFVRWLLAQQPCTVRDTYGADWTERVRVDGIGVLYPATLDQ